MSDISLTALIGRVCAQVTSRRTHGTSLHEVVRDVDGRVTILGGLTYQEAAIVKAEERALLALLKLGWSPARLEEARAAYRALQGDWKTRLQALIGAYKLSVVAPRRGRALGQLESRHVAR